MASKKMKKALAAGLAAYAASKMGGAGKDSVDTSALYNDMTGTTAGPNEPSLLKSIVKRFNRPSINQRSMDSNEFVGFSKGSKNAVVAKCKMGKNKPTKLY